MKKPAKIILLLVAGGAAFVAGFIGFGVYSMFAAFSATRVYQKSGPAALASLKKIVLVENFQKMQNVELYAVFQFQDGVTWYRFYCDREDVTAMAAVLGVSDTYPISIINGKLVRVCK